MLNNGTLKRADDFKYLGTQINEDEDQDRKTGCHIAQTRTAFMKMKKGTLQTYVLDFKIQNFDVLCLSVLLYCRTEYLVEWNKSLNLEFVLILLNSS